MPLINNNNSNQLGQLAERVAKEFLLDSGLTLVTCNYHSRAGEIDIVMRDGATWVFVEVKFRKTATHGSAVDFFHHAKRKKFIRAVQYYMHNHGLNPAAVDHRVDLVAIDGSIHPDNIQWFKSV